MSSLSATKLSEDQEARADIIIRKDENGDPIKLGWLTLPSFYADMDKHQKSTTRDVLALLKRLKKENIAAWSSTCGEMAAARWRRPLAHGLFLKSGPIVQTKDYNGSIRVSANPDPGHRLFGAHGRLDQPAKRVRERNLRRRSAGLWSRGGRWRQKHIREGDVQTILPDWEVRFTAGQPFR